jgi:peptide/nickel transport system ATP-binding protein
MTATVAPRVEVSDLQIRIGLNGPDVVDEVGFTITPGEILGLVGESGSGKTTVALSLLGYARRGLTISRGQVLVDGVDVLGLSPQELREVRGAKVAYVPQDPSAALNPTLRIGRQLREALRAHPGVAADPDERIAQVLVDAKLDPASGILRKYPHQLSGGQQQRVAIAMAFLCRSSVIVLDEPTTGLDVSTQRHVLDTVRNLCSIYGVAAVYVSHDLAVVSGLVSQVAVMYAGRIIELGTTEAVFSTPIHPYTQGLLAAVPSPDRAETLIGVPGQPPRPGRRPVGCSFAPRCPYVQNHCRQEVPAPIDIDARLVRCWRARETAGSARLTGQPVIAGPPRAETLLEVSRLDAHYGRFHVLQDVSLQIAPQTCMAVVGESGSGKTTLARCVVGLHAHWTGQMRYGGQPLAAGARARPKAVLEKIQYIFQNPYTSLNPRKTVDQIVGQPLEQFHRLPAAEREERVLQVLEEVNLGPDFLPRSPDQLSGGERQRVAIARALVVEPTLLVCDEVTSSLDVSVQAVIVELLRRLQRERQLTMLFITHNLALVRSIAQTAVVLSGGRVVEAGPVEEIMKQPRDPYTIRLLQDVPKLAHREAATGGPPPYAPELPDGVAQPLDHVSGTAGADLPPRAGG